MSVYKDEKEQLIEDIQYFEYLINVEKSNIKERITAGIDSSAPLQQQVESISDELAKILAQMSARIAVVEKSLVGLDVEPSQSSLQNLQRGSNIGALVESVSNIEASDKPVLLDEVKVSIVDIGKKNRLGWLEHTADDVPYHNLTSGSRVQFELRVCRVKKQTLAVDVVEVSQAKILNDAKFIIDGHPLKHKIITVEGKQRLICYLPKSTTGNTTHVQLIMPKNSYDKPFKLAISDIHCVPKLSFLKALKNKLVGK